jgi:hypothetical protein
MIIRVRTNVGQARVEIPPTCSIQELKKKIMEKLNIVDSSEEDLLVAVDLAGEKQIDGSQDTVEKAGLKHGDEVFVLGKFVEIVVDKSYVNEKHEMVQAGKKLKLSEPHASAKPKATQVISKPVEPPQEAKKAETKPAHAAPIPAPTTSAPTKPIEDEIDPSLYQFDDAEEEDGMRAPDQVQRMQLVDDPYAAAMDRLTEADHAQLETYHATLVEAGLSEYEIQTYMTEYRNDMLAQRFVICHFFCIHYQIIAPVRMVNTMAEEDTMDMFGGMAPPTSCKYFFTCFIV